MSDTDKDGLSDFIERWYGSDPNEADSDRDGMNDGDEVDLGWDPTKSEPGAGRQPLADMDRRWEDLDRSYEEAREMLRDSDYDGLDNHTERKLGLDPFNRDTDGDKLDDGVEIQLGLDPKDNLADPAEATPHVPMRLDESFSAHVEPSTPMTPIEAEPLYETTAAEPYTADDSLADASVRSTTAGRHPRTGSSTCSGRRLSECGTALEAVAIAIHDRWPCSPADGHSPDRSGCPQSDSTISVSESRNRDCDARKPSACLMHPARAIRDSIKLALSAHVDAPRRPSPTAGPGAPRSVPAL